MWHDLIVDDIHKVREAYAAKFNHDIAAMVRDLQEKAKERQEHPIEFLAQSAHTQVQQVLR